MAFWTFHFIIRGFGCERREVSTLAADIVVAWLAVKLPVAVGHTLKAQIADVAPKRLGLHIQQFMALLTLKHLLHYIISNISQILSGSLNAP